MLSTINWYKVVVSQKLLSGTEGSSVSTALNMVVTKMEETKEVKMSVDSGMVVVIFICLMYIVLVFGLLFYVKNDWCDLLFKNMTVYENNK